MASKTLTITEAAYERLLAEKRAGESFTDVIMRLTKKRSLFDLHKVISKKEADSLAEAYLEMRTEKQKLLESRERERDELWAPRDKPSDRR